MQWHRTFHSLQTKVQISNHDHPRSRPTMISKMPGKQRTLASLSSPLTEYLSVSELCSRLFPVII